MAIKNYNPKTDIPSLTGKTIFITGGTGGIGRETIIHLASHSPSQIFFTGRSTTSASSLITHVSSTSPSTTLTHIPCNPHSLTSISSAASLFLSQATRLDVFIANLGAHVNTPSLTDDGYEVHFGLNHVHNFAFLRAFLPLMLRTAESPGSDVRYVAVTSQGTGLHPRAGIDYTSIRKTNAFDYSPPLGGTWVRYGQSKLANVLIAKELARRHPSITSLAVHPGVVETGFLRDLTVFDRAVSRLSQISNGGSKQPHEGAYNTCWAATAGDVRKIVEEEKGRTAWFEPVAMGVKGTEKCFDEEMGRELWEWTMRELDAKMGKIPS